MAEKTTLRAPCCDLGRKLIEWGQAFREPADFGQPAEGWLLELSDGGLGVEVRVSFCPWCGQELPPMAAKADWLVHCVVRGSVEDEATAETACGRLGAELLKESKGHFFAPFGAFMKRSHSMALMGGDAWCLACATAPAEEIVKAALVASACAGEPKP